MALNSFPNLLVTRLETKRFGALDVAEWIRTMKSPSPVPIVIYDDCLQGDMRRQLQRFGVTEFFNKHASADTFRTQLMRLVEQIESRAHESVND